MVAADRARLAEKIAAGRPRWTWMSIEKSLPAELETITRIEAEIAALEAQS